MIAIKDNEAFVTNTPMPNACATWSYLCPHAPYFQGPADKLTYLSDPASRKGVPPKNS